MFNYGYGVYGKSLLFATHYLTWRLQAQVYGMLNSNHNDSNIREYVIRITKVEKNVRVNSLEKRVKV